MTTKDVLTLAVSTVVAGIALGTLLKACMEYVRQGRMGRAQMFFELRQRLKQEPLAHLAEWIDEADCADEAIAAPARDRLASAPLRTKRDYLGLFEEIDIAMDSRLIKPEIASYMFGYYALRCAESEAFWNGVNPLSPYWNRFFDFCRKMQVEEARLLEQERVAIDLPRVAARPTPESPAATPAQGVAAQAAAGTGSASASVSVTVQIPPVLRSSANGCKTVEVPGTTVGEVLERLVARYPSMRSYLFDADEAQPNLQRYINVYLDHEDVRVLDGLDTQVAAGSHITFLPSASGG